MRRTKIVATIGPACSTMESLLALVEAGMDAARLNFSHGDHAEHVARAELVREVQAKVGRPLALIADLQGPKIRVGELDAPRVLVNGDEIVIVPEEQARNGELPVAPAIISELLRPGNDVLIDDGRVRLRVQHVEGARATCTVIAGGTVSSNKGVNLPGVPLPIPSLTKKDLADLKLALELEVDFVALSFVRAANDVLELRKIIDEAGSSAGIIAKIEMPEAIDALAEVLDATDAVMVARGDLGVEAGPAAVPLLQKRIIKESLERGKPVITATQMLESMISSPEPTRAEASDVANAVLDGTSAIMLSGETAVGKYPIEAVRTMDTICRAVEPSLGYRHQTPQAEDKPTIGQAMSNAACDIAEALGATAMLVPTFSGRTASAVARLLPRRPIIGLSHHQYALQQMALEWGITPLPIEQCPDIEELWERSIHAARESGIIKTGDRVVITAGTAVNIPGSTNVIKVEIV
ncbi:MAG: pyruvate kinase [Gaiellaceae bacterium]|nr:pyruvate kinase [Gaiellaceae bacterium]